MLEKPGINYFAAGHETPGIKEEVFGEGTLVVGFVLDSKNVKGAVAGGGNDRVNFAYLEDVGDMVAVALAEDEVWGRGGLENGIVGSIVMRDEFVAKTRSAANMSLSPPLVLRRSTAGRSLIATL